MPEELDSPMDDIKEHLDNIKIKNSQDTDIIFLKTLMDNKAIKSLVKAHSTLEEKKLNPLNSDSLPVTDEIYEWCLHNVEEKLLSAITKYFQNQYFLSLLEAHDSIALKYIEKSDASFNSLSTQEVLNNTNVDSFIPESAMRMVGIKIYKGQSLGITIKEEDDGEFVVARILQGGLVDKQGLLHSGDIIKEINGVPVRNIDQIQYNFKHAEDSLTLKILPSYTERIFPNPIYLKALFDYDPKKDNLIPSKDAGLKFNDGDILEILNKEDPNWWQAKKIRTENVNETLSSVSIDDECARLIPSQTLEESRKAFVKQRDIGVITCGTITKKKRKLYYQADKNFDFDNCDVHVYQEVSRMPPFQRKCLVLVGPRGIGKGFLKQWIINSHPNEFGIAIPHTSRQKRAGEVNAKTYNFTDRSKMEVDIVNNMYLESGELNGNLYGTKFDSIKKVIESGRMCVLTCNPQSLNLLSNPTFTPFVVFVGSPSLDQLHRLWKTIPDDCNVIINQENGVEKRKQANSNNGLSKDGNDIQTNTPKKQHPLHPKLPPALLLSPIRNPHDSDCYEIFDESASVKLNYDHMFDLCIINHNMNETYQIIMDALNKLKTETQWVPARWVF